MWGGRKERYEREKRGLREGKRRYCLNKEMEERYWSQFSKQRDLFGSHSQQGDWNWSMLCIKKNFWKKCPSLRPALSLRSGIFFLYPSWKTQPKPAWCWSQLVWAGLKLFQLPSKTSRTVPKTPLKPPKTSKKTQLKGLVFPQNEFTTFSENSCHQQICLENTWYY